MYHKNAWKKYQDNLDVVMNFNEGYKEMISYGKTERLFAKAAVKKLEEKGFKSADKVSSLKTGESSMSKNWTVWLSAEL